MCTNILSPSTFYRIHTAAEIYKAVYMWAVLLLKMFFNSLWVTCLTFGKHRTSARNVSSPNILYNPG